MTIRDFVYDWLGSLLSLFFWPYYPASAFLLLYVLYLLVKKRRQNTYILVPAMLFALVPAALAMVYVVLELLFVKQSTGSAYILLAFGIGFFVNIASILLYCLYVKQRQIAAHPLP
jgi:hypothetical protein